MVTEVPTVPEDGERLEIVRFDRVTLSVVVPPAGAGIWGLNAVPYPLADAWRSYDPGARFPRE